LDNYIPILQKHEHKSNTASVDLNFDLQVVFVACEDFSEINCNLVHFNNEKGCFRNV